MDYLLHTEKTQIKVGRMGSSLFDKTKSKKEKKYYLEIIAYLHTMEHPNLTIVSFIETYIVLKRVGDHS